MTHNIQSIIEALQEIADRGSRPQQIAVRQARHLLEQSHDVGDGAMAAFAEEA